MQAIILAAGMGTRLGGFTVAKPKAMVEFLKRPLLEWQIEALRAGGVKDIVIVTGYKSESIQFSDISYVHNPNFSTTNMVESLMCAREFLQDGFILSYADIIYETALVTALCQNEDDIAVVGDRAWRRYWRMRFGDCETDIESFTADEACNIHQIGAPVATSEGLTHRYVGLLKFSASGARALCEVYDHQKHHGANWPQSGKEFCGGYMTDILYSLIESGRSVKVTETINGWMEFDEPGDLHLGEKLFKANMLGTIGAFSEAQVEKEKQTLRQSLLYDFSQFDQNQYGQFLERLRKWGRSVPDPVMLPQAVTLTKKTLAADLVPDKWLNGQNTVDAQANLIHLLCAMDENGFDVSAANLLDELQKVFEVQKHLSVNWSEGDCKKSWGAYLQSELYAAFALCMQLRFLQTGNYNYLNSAIKANDVVIGYLEKLTTLLPEVASKKDSGVIGLSLGFARSIIQRLFREVNEEYGVKSK